jgi:hypothetical protein
MGSEIKESPGVAKVSADKLSAPYREPCTTASTTKPKRACGVLEYARREIVEKDDGLCLILTQTLGTDPIPVSPVILLTVVNLRHHGYRGLAV